MTAPRVLVCGSWDLGDGYPRPRSLIAALESLGLQVEQWRMELPYTGRAKQRLAARPHLWPLLLARLATARHRFRRGIAEAVRRCRPDAVLVPYPGHLVVHWVRSVHAGPVVLDLFLSAHDTLVGDRRRFKPGSFAAAALRALDRRACAAADLVLLDTPEHAAHVAGEVGLPGSRFAWVPVGDPHAAVAAPYREPRGSEPLEVLFFGTGVPLHGLGHLLEAVRRTPGIRLTLIGGSTAERRLAGSIAHVQVCAPFVDGAALERALERSHLVAGIFGDSGKAGRVVPFKVIHALAAGRPVLTADTPAVRRFLAPGDECLLCPAADAAALAQALAAARADPQHLARIAGRSRAAYERCFSTRAVATHLGAALERLGLHLPIRQPSPAAPSPALTLVSAAPGR